MSLNAPTTALVLEGGGMRGVYTAGVLDVLLANDVRVGWVGGISAGATNTVAYLDGTATSSRPPRSPSSPA